MFVKVIFYQRNRLCNSNVLLGLKTKNNGNEGKVVIRMGKYKPRYLKKAQDKRKIKNTIPYITYERRKIEKYGGSVITEVNFDNSEDVVKAEILYSMIKDTDILDHMDLRYHYEPDTGNHVYQASISVIGGELNG